MVFYICIDIAYEKHFLYELWNNEKCLSINYNDGS